MQDWHRAKPYALLRFLAIEGSDAVALLSPLPRRSFPPQPQQARRIHKPVRKALGSQSAKNHVAQASAFLGRGLFWYSQRRSPRPAKDDAPFLPPLTPVEWIAINGIFAVIAATTPVVFWR